MLGLGETDEEILQVMRDCGHVPFIEKPAQFLAIVDPFLQEHAR